MSARRTGATKLTEFGELACAVEDCRLCARMDDRSRVLSPANGPLNAKIMFIGEAPGRLGADATRIPFHGDKAGDNFESLIFQVGLNRYDLFVTNAVLCNPRTADGNNSPPTRGELENCTSFLRSQIGLIDPRLVVTLGAQSLTALDFISPHGLKLASSVRRIFPWNGRLLIPLYHPGQRAMIHRSFLNQLADYQFVAESFRRNASQTSRSARNTSSRRLEGLIAYCVRALLRRSGELSYFRLHKLFYLLEYAQFRATGARLSGAYIIRQKDGPYVAELNIGVLQRKMDDIRVMRGDKGIVLRLQTDDDLFGEANTATTFDEFDHLIDRVWSRYGKLTNERLKSAVYLTSPMRKLLRLEKYSRSSTFNQPIEF